MTEAVSQTLIWVNEELASTLAEARQSLENYIERPENSALLKACADLMHEASGALMMVEVQGGSLLAEEVEKVARRLLEAPADQQTRAEALEALARSGDREALFVEKRADLADHHDVVALVITPVATPLDRLELRELLLPVAQDVRLDAAEVADFAYGEIPLAGNRRKFVVIARFQHMLQLLFLVFARA